MSLVQSKNLIWMVLGAVTAMNLLSGCGKDSDATASGLNGSYQYVDGGCDTGVHSYASKNELCQKLQDHNLNQNCAFGMRDERARSVGCN